MRARGWRNSSLRTRSSIERARRLYERRGSRLTTDVKHLVDSAEILRYELDITT
jgi:hypothetical protein